MTKSAWRLVYTKPQQEQRARANLERQGFTTFLPHLRTQVRRGGRFRARVVPMFPRYLFLHLDHEDWSPVRSTLGVSTLVRCGDHPAIVPADLVEALRAAADDDDIVHDLTPPEVEAGTRVRVIDGLLQNYEGIVQATSGPERVRILLDLADRATIATLSRDHVTPVTR